MKEKENKNEDTQEYEKDRHYDNRPTSSTIHMEMRRKRKKRI